MGSFFKLAVGLLSVAVIFNACKEPEGIGLDVLPDGEELSIAWVDSFAIEASTVLDDSVITSNLNNTYLIGDFGDPVFGRVRSELYTQFLLPSSNVDFGDQPQIDSIVLSLAYSGSYGYTDKLKGTMTFGVAELQEPIEDDSTYYSNVQRVCDPNLLGVRTFRPELLSNIVAGTDTLPPSLRIRLNDQFGQRILNSQNTASNASFLNEFNGICVAPQQATMPSGFGSILYFNMVSSFSRLELHYHNTEDTVQLNLAINEDAATHTRFEHEFSQQVLDAVSGDTQTGAQQLYIRSMAGLKTKLDFPHLRQLNELGAVAISKAELVVPLDDSFVPEHGVPNSLQATAIDSGGSSDFLIDFFEGTDYYGGGYRSVEKEYVFNIARHVQSVLDNPEEPDYGLYILNSGNAVNARRGVFNGPQHPTKPMKLRMTYTILN